MEFVLSVKNILIFPKWKVTISHLGTKEEKLSKKTVKCFVKIATEEKAENKKRHTTTYIKNSGFSA